MIDFEEQAKTWNQSHRVNFPPPYSRHSSWFAIVKREGFPDVLAEKEDNNASATYHAANEPNNCYVYGATPGGGLEIFYDDLNDYSGGISAESALGLIACLMAAREEMASFKE